MRIKLGTPLLFSEISAAIGFSYQRKSDVVINFISTDSRECKEGDLYFSQRVSGIDADKYSKEAKKVGAKVISPSVNYSDVCVNSTTEALFSLASYYKRMLKNLKSTVAITGSVGKSTTKEFVKTILSSKYTVRATRENYNNDIGLPLTMLEAPLETEILILELGMNHMGEIAMLSRIATPDISLITNVGTAHIGNLGSREGIAKAKLEILEGMEQKRLIIPYGEPLLEAEAQITSFSVDTSLSDYSVYAKSKSEFGYTVKIKTPKYEIEEADFKICGYHNLYALAGAVAIADAVGIAKEELKEGIEKISESLVRQKMIRIGSIRIYDDTYSASPEAVIANLKMIADIFVTKSCVLGDMLELGDEAEKAHVGIGYAAARLGYRNIYTFGNYSKHIARGVMLYDAKNVACIENDNLCAPEITAKKILENKIDGEVILIKASNKIRAHRIYEKIQELSGEEND